MRRDGDETMRICQCAPVLVLLRQHQGGYGVASGARMLGTRLYEGGNGKDKLSRVSFSE